MSKEINLATSKRKSSSPTFAQAEVIKKISYAFLALCVVFAIFIFVANTMVSLTELSQKEKNLENTLLGSQKKIIKLYLVRDRLTSIATIIQSRTTLENMIQTISDALPPNGTFESFQISKKNLSIVMSSSSLLSVNSFLDFIIDNVNKKQLFQKVTVTSLVGDIPSGKYILSLDIILQ